MEIRHATADDLDTLVEIENLSFPPAEAATRDQIRQRLAIFPDCYWLAVEPAGHDGAGSVPAAETILACVDGLASTERDLDDSLFEDAGRHEPGGPWLMLCGVVTRPDRRGQGLASALLERVIGDWRQAGRAGLVLTCKNHLRSWYASFGFVDEGRSASGHGGAAWYQMRLTF